MKNKQEIAALAKKAYELGFKYEKLYKGCGQCLVGALLDTLEIESNEVFKATTGFAGGIGALGDGSCGAYVGGALLLGLYVGREKENFADPTNIRWKTYALIKKYHDRFIEKFGNVACRDIQCKIFGRPYYLADKDEFMKLEEAGGHEDKCTGVVGWASQALVGLLAEENLI